MIVLKSSSDPLQGISLLNMIIIVSRNQVFLPSFIPLMITSEEYKALNLEKQNNIK